VSGTRDTFWHDTGPEVPQPELKLQERYVGLIENHPSRDDRISEDVDIAADKEGYDRQPLHIYTSL
jgi:hypothetical protein